MTRPNEVARHGITHVTEANESDFHDFILPLYEMPSASACSQAMSGGQGDGYFREIVVFTLPADIESSNQRTVTVLVCV